MCPNENLCVEKEKGSEVWQELREFWKENPKDFWKIEIANDTVGLRGTSSSELTNYARKSPGGVHYLGFQTNIEEGELKRIELAARTCYKSEDRITSESAISLFRNLVRRGHFAMVRFGERTVYIRKEMWDRVIEPLLVDTKQIQYWRWVFRYDISLIHEWIIVSANLQSWMFLVKAILARMSHMSVTLDSVMLDHIKVISIIQDIFKEWPIVTEAMKYSIDRCYDCFQHRFYTRNFEETLDVFDDDFKARDNWQEITHNTLHIPLFEPLRRQMFRIVCNRGITHEIVRHTTLSYAQESTRYVKYDGNDPDAITKVLFVPEHLKEHPSFDMKVQCSFPVMMGMCLEAYAWWSENDNPDLKLIPGDARDFLPHSLKTEICLSGYLDESEYGTEFNQGYSHFIDMRWDRHAHKGIQPIARKMSTVLHYPKNISGCGGLEKV